MVTAARRAGLGPLIAPVRPSWKDRYPLIPIAAYAAWQRGDGLPFDPWMRVHARLGAGVLRPEPQSMQITAPVADWQEWTGLLLPWPGQYVFPGGLAPLTVARGTGEVLGTKRLDAAPRRLKARASGPPPRTAILSHRSCNQGRSLASKESAIRRRAGHEIGSPQ
jgi:hypothetical protein